MLDSVLVQMKAAYDGYWSSKRNEWITKWCGQITQTVSRTIWTKEVRDRKSDNTIPVIELIPSIIITTVTKPYNKYTKYILGISSKIGSTFPIFALKNENL